MYKIKSFVFALCLAAVSGLLHKANAQIHIKGIQGVQLDAGINGMNAGINVNLGYVRFFHPKWHYGVLAGYDQSVENDITYKAYSLKPRLYYAAYSFAEKLFVNALAGSFLSHEQFAFENPEEGVSPSPLAYGVEGGVQLEYYLSSNVSLILEGTQGLNFGKAKGGRYQINFGMRYFLH